MIHRALDVLFSPVLIPLGVYTKWKTPRLAEPSGARVGQVGTPHKPKLRLLLLGDSAAAGVGTEQQADALSGHLTQQLAQQFHCEWTLHARSGWTSQQLLDSLKKIPSQHFDVAIVSIGVNDVLQPLSILGWQQRLRRLDWALKTGLGVKYIIYSALPPMHNFPALPQPLRYFLGYNAHSFNQLLVDEFAAQKDSLVLKIDIPFEKRFMAKDGFHPSAVGYAMWAKHAAEAVNQYILAKSV